MKMKGVSLAESGEILRSGNTAILSQPTALSFGATYQQSYRRVGPFYIIIIREGCETRGKLDGWRNNQHAGKKKSSAEPAASSQQLTAVTRHTAHSAIWTAAHIQQPRRTQRTHRAERRGHNHTPPNHNHHTHAHNKLFLGGENE